jgi:catechol 2,3-dioxygenase-like lactoylglutathione lyase family enzyme
MDISRIHHVAYRCNDAKETVQFYRDVLGMEFLMAFSEDRVPSTQEPDPYMHVFLDAGNGNVLAFFELPTLEALARGKQRAEEHGLAVIGPVDHGLFHSIYFFDPNGHRLELAANVGGEDEYRRAREVAEEMLDEWNRTKRAPRHNAWLHSTELRDS